MLEYIKESVKEEVLAELEDILDRPYTIAEASDELNVPQRTLRYQVQAKLIETCPKSGSKHRIPSSEVKRLKGLKGLK